MESACFFRPVAELKVQSASWRVITPSLMDELPSNPGIFEFGSLVRSVLYVGAAPAGLAPAIREALATPRLAKRAHCLRFEIAENAEIRARKLLTDYQRVHRGELPDAHRGRVRSLKVATRSTT